MAYTPREIKDRVAVGDDIFQVEDLGNNRIRLIPAPTHVSEPGTPINKALLQPIEDYLATGVVPVERTITAGDGLIGGGNLSANRTLSLGTPGTLSGATYNYVMGTSHTHAISVATQAEAEAGTDNVKLMTPLRVVQTLNKKLPVVFAQADPKSASPPFIDVVRYASSPTDYNTIRFAPFLGEDENNRLYSLYFSSLGDVVVGTPQYLLNTSFTLSSSDMLEFRYFSPENQLTLRGVDIYHGITMFTPYRVEFRAVRASESSAAISDVYLHFRFTGLRLA
jgi:hypothetical protein